MLSRMLFSRGLRRALPIIVHPVRIYTKYGSNSSGSSISTVLIPSQDINKHVWNVDNDPNRDLVNFPRPERKEYPDKVRFGIVPEEWFGLLYSRTGVLGPFVLATGLVTFLVSKEIYVLEHEFYTGISVATVCYFAIKKIGPYLANYLDKEIDEIDDMWYFVKEGSLQQYTGAIKMEKEEQWRAEGQKTVYDAKKELVAIQLETEYRERIMEAYNQVKRRLDYELERHKAVQFVAHKNIVDWVVRRVMESITPALDSVALRRCISEVAALGSHMHPFPIPWQPSPFRILIPNKLSAEIAIPLLTQQLSCNEIICVVNNSNVGNTVVILKISNIKSVKHREVIFFSFSDIW